MELFVAVLIAVAGTWAIKRGSEKVAENARKWWGNVSARTAASSGGRAAYEGARAGVRGAVTLGYGVGSGAAAGWREGWTRAADWRDARREANAARDLWGGLPRHHKVNGDVQDAADPWWQRGRLHGRRDQVAPDSDKVPPVYGRGVEQGRVDRRAGELSDEQLYDLGFLDGLRNTRPQHAAPAYRRGWRDGQDAATTPDDDEPPGEQPPAAEPEPDEGEAPMSAPAAQPAAAPPAYQIGATAEVNDLTSALAFAQALKAEADQEVETAQAAVGVAQSELEEYQSALTRANVKLAALEVYEAALAGLGFGSRLRAHVHQMVEGARARRNAAQAAVEAAQQQLAAAKKTLAGAEQEQAQANALVRSLLSHRNVQEAAAGATGGMAHRQVYGGAPERAGAR